MLPEFVVPILESIRTDLLISSNRKTFVSPLAKRVIPLFPNVQRIYHEPLGTNEFTPVFVALQISGIRKVKKTLLQVTPSGITSCTGSPSDMRL